MKPGWEVQALGEIYQIELGKTPYRDNQRYWDPDKLTKNVWISISDLLNSENKHVFDSKEYISNEGANNCKIVKAGTLLLSFKLTIGRMAFAGKDLYTNEAIAALTPKNPNISKEYLYYFLTHFDWNSVTENDIKIKGKTLNKAKLREIPIQYPKSLTEQQRIVAVLDEAFAAIANAKTNAEKNLQNVREVFETYLNDIFADPGEGWEEKSLADIAVIKGGKRVPKGYRLETKPTGHPYIRVTDFNDQGSIDLDDIHYVNDDVYRMIKNYTISENNLYISIAGTIGKTGMVPTVLDGANLTENACKLVFIKGIEPKFVYYFTKTSSFLNQAGLNTRVAAMPKLALSRLSTIKFSIPKEIGDQSAVIHRLDSLVTETKKLEHIYQQKLIELEELKRSILQKAFNGEL